MLLYGNPNLDKPKVLLLALSGVYCFHGSTKGTGLGISIWNFGSKLPSVSDKMKLNLRNRSSQIKVLIIDEILLVSNDLLLHVHCRLIEVFSCRTDIPFPGITILAVEDFLQLPPVIKITQNTKLTD